MKSTLFVFLLVAAAANCQTAAEFTTGQAARIAIGQADFTDDTQGATQKLVGAVGGLAYANGTLFVVDSNRVGAAPVNERVLIFKNISNVLPQPADELPYSSRCPVCVGTASVVLGQPDFTSTSISLSQTGMREATAIASDGNILAVADTDNNRVLIWNQIPNANGVPADVVIGQPDFNTSAITSNVPTAKSMRGPEGVWIQAGRLYVADTQNHRILIYNSIPKTNGVAADHVLGQPNLTTYVQPDLTKADLGGTSSNMEDPVSVTSDGVRLYVSDLGHNRVMIWNKIPTTDNVPADVIVGQPDPASSAPDNTPALCGPSYMGMVMVSNPAGTGVVTTDPTTGETTESGSTIDWVSGDQFSTVNAGDPILINGTLYQVESVTSTTELIITVEIPAASSVAYDSYPAECNSTLDTPRYALSDGTHLFIADGGNDRVLVFNSVPTSNGASADEVLGQLGGTINQASDATDSLRTPMSLAWDGQILFGGVCYNDRIVAYTPEPASVPYSGVRNAASLNVYAVGNVVIGGTITAGDTITITINSTDYTYTVLKTDTLDTVVQGLVTAIASSNNGLGDPNAFAIADLAIEAIELTATAPGTDGNNVTLTTTTSTNATETATASGANLSGGGDAASIGPGSLVSVLAQESISDNTVSTGADVQVFPTSLGGAEVYMDGVQTPLVSVSPLEITAQVPYEFQDRTSSSVWVRTVHSDGSVTVSSPIAMTVVPQNPGIFAQMGTEPRVAMMMHGSTQASGTVSVDGSINAGDVGTVTIEDRSYSYTVQASDTLASVRDALVVLINQDPKVEAFAAVSFTRIRLRARVPGPDGNGIAFSGSNSSGAQLIITAFNSQLCCANPRTGDTGESGAAGRDDRHLRHGPGIVLPAYRADRNALQRTAHGAEVFRLLARGRQDGQRARSHARAGTGGNLSGGARAQHGHDYRSVDAIDYCAGYLRQQYCHVSAGERESGEHDDFDFECQAEARGAGSALGKVQKHFTQSSRPDCVGVDRPRNSTLVKQVLYFQCGNFKFPESSRGRKEDKNPDFSLRLRGA